MDKSRWMYFAAGFIVCFALLIALKHFFGGGDSSSPRIEKLMRDSVEYVNWRQDAERRYNALDSAYKADTKSLHSAIDSIANARRKRPASRINSSDSLLRAIERAVGSVPVQ